MCAPLWTVQTDPIRSVMQNNSAEVSSPAKSPDTTAAVDAAPASTTTQPQLNAPASSCVSETVTKPTPSVSDCERRPRPPKLKSKFIPEDVHMLLPREIGTQAPQESSLPDHTVRLDYELVLRGGREEVLRVKSQLVLPMALEVENLAQTDLSFPEMFDRVIVRPLVTKFRGFLQKRFDAASAAEATNRSEAEPSSSSLPTNNIKLPKPMNGTEFCRPGESR